MTDEIREVTKSQLAVALARGISVSAWAQAHNVPRPTVYRWASEPEVRQEIAACRRRMVDQVVGLMVKRARKAVAGIGALADGAESETVRLKALLSILSQMMAVSRFGDLEQRMTEIEEQLNDRAGNTGQTG
jgi:Homeodomain-like domain